MNDSPRTRPRPYIPEIGKSVVKKVLKPCSKTLEQGFGRLIDLSLNESSYGASPRAIEAAITRARQAHRYPDPASTELREAIGRAYDLDPERITCGNGSEELLDVIGRLFARPGDEILFSEYAFMQFPIVAMRVGATAVTVPGNGLTASVDALLGGVSERTRVLFLANPDNPTGTYINRDELHRLHAGLPGHVVLVIDSAYAEYVTGDNYSDGMELADAHENVIMTRTFSKAFGLAGLRVGWGYSSLAMAQVINRMRGIGNVNAVAQEAARAAVQDLDFVREVRDRTEVERARVAKALRAIGLEVESGTCNFVMARFPADTNHTADAAHAYMAERGIILRKVDDYGLNDYLRITLGDEQENDALIAALKSFMV